jgi:hypothetical protein
MTKPVAWNSKLAIIGLGALFVYILACTSFSPDDSKVLYITTDPKTGMTAVAVYDRKSAKSDVLFEPPLSHDVTDPTAAKAAIMRPQWLDGGHNILAAWLPGGNDSEKPLNIAVLPFDRSSPARTFQLSGLGPDGGSGIYLWPLPVVGSSLFLNGSSNSILRLNLETGEIHRQTNAQQLLLLPSPDNDRLFYLGGGDDPQSPGEFGLLNPETFTRTPLFKINDTNISEMSIVLSRDAKRLAYQPDDYPPRLVHLLESGQPARTLSLASLGESTEVMIRCFSPGGDTLYGSFSDSSGGTNVAYGFVEIPLDGSTIRKTTLISDVEGGYKDMFESFQIDVSHDGRTLAVESLWLGYSVHPIKAGDCALFLVDLAHPQHKITKVPIPLPPVDQPSPFK